MESNFRGFADSLHFRRVGKSWNIFDIFWFYPTEWESNFGGFADSLNIARIQKICKCWNMLTFFLIWGNLYWNVQLSLNLSQLQFGIFTLCFDWIQVILGSSSPEGSNQTCLPYILFVWTYLLRWITIHPPPTELQNVRDMEDISV